MSAYQSVNPATNKVMKTRPAHSGRYVESALEKRGSFGNPTGQEALFSHVFRYCISWRI